MKPILNEHYLEKPEDEAMYDQYMEILKHNMDREKREARRRSAGLEIQKKEAENIPVGKHCVRSLYTAMNKKKNLMLANMSVDKVMRDNHNREVFDRNVSNEVNQKTKAENKCLLKD